MGPESLHFPQLSDDVLTYTLNSEGLERHRGGVAKALGGGGRVGHCKQRNSKCECRGVRVMSTLPLWLRPVGQRLKETELHWWEADGELAVEVPEGS